MNPEAKENQKNERSYDLHFNIRKNHQLLVWLALVTKGNNTKPIQDPWSVDIK